MCLQVLLVKDVIDFLESKFPPTLAFEWDNIGLHIGDINQEIHTIMVVLEATTDVIEEAVSQDVDLIIAHHPFIFSSLKSIDFATSKGRNIKKLIQNDIALYVMHSNYDIANGGMGDVLAEKVGLLNVKPFSMIDEAHGEGRIGKLKVAMNINELSNLIFESLAPNISFINKVECETIKSIETVAIIPGSGGKYIYKAKKAGADLLITGDIKYHDAIDAKDIGLNILDIGHYAEVVMEEHVAGLLQEQFDVKIIVPTVATNPIERK